MRVQEYRNKHKRCRFCIYAERDLAFLPPYIAIDDTISWCNVKRKRVRLNIPRWFCEGYIADSASVINYRNEEIIS